MLSTHDVNEIRIFLQRRTPQEDIRPLLQKILLNEAEEIIQTGKEIPSYEAIQQVKDKYDGQRLTDLIKKVKAEEGKKIYGAFREGIIQRLAFPGIPIFLFLFVGHYLVFKHASEYFMDVFNMTVSFTFFMAFAAYFYLYYTQNIENSLYKLLFYKSFDKALVLWVFYPVISIELGAWFFGGFDSPIWGNDWFQIILRTISWSFFTIAVLTFFDLKRTKIKPGKFSMVS